MPARVMLSPFQARAATVTVSFPGTLSGSGAPTTVTGTSRNASVTAPNTGVLSLQDFVMTGLVTLQSNIAGGGWVTRGEGDFITVADTNSLQFRIINAASGEALTFNLVDNTTSALIEAVTLVSI